MSRKLFGRSFKKNAPLRYFGSDAPASDDGYWYEERMFPKYYTKTDDGLKYRQRLAYKKDAEKKRLDCNPHELLYELYPEAWECKADTGRWVFNSKPGFKSKKYTEKELEDHIRKNKSSLKALLDKRYSSTLNKPFIRQRGNFKLLKDDYLLNLLNRTEKEKSRSRSRSRSSSPNIPSDDRPARPTMVPVPMRPKNPPPRQRSPSVPQRPTAPTVPVRMNSPQRPIPLRHSTASHLAMKHKLSQKIHTETELLKFLKCGTLCLDEEDTLDNLINFYVAITEIIHEKFSRHVSPEVIAKLEEKVEEKMRKSLEKAPMLMLEDIQRELRAASPRLEVEEVEIESDEE